MRSLGWLVLLAVVGVARGQQVEITPDMPVDSAVLRQWLHSREPRLIAWAADFARRRNDAAVLAEMPGLLEHWATPPINERGESRAGRRRAAMTMLDALIEDQVRVSVEAIQQVRPDFPTQAAILIARLPLSESVNTLHQWFSGQVEGRDGPTLARVAAMMMATDPEPAFVADVVKSAEEELRVFVVPASVGVGRGGSGMSCGSIGAASPISGWPQIYGYHLVENSSGVNAGLLVELDGDRIEYDRFEESHGPASCGGVRPLDAVTRHRLIARWLGIPDSAMSWQPVESACIVWTDEAAYRAELGTIIDAQRRKLQVTVAGLRTRGLLREGDASDIMPRLMVTVGCEIKPCPLGD